MPTEPERRETPAEIDVRIHQRIVRFALALSLQDVDPLPLVLGLRMAADRIAQQSREASAEKSGRSSKRPTPRGR